MSRSGSFSGAAAGKDAWDDSTVILDEFTVCARDCVREMAVLHDVGRAEPCRSVFQVVDAWQDHPLTHRQTLLKFCRLCPRQSNSSMLCLGLTAV